STVNATFRGKDRATAFGIWGATMAGMAAIGPLLGGWLTTSFEWRWIFYVNVPIGVLVIVAALLFVPKTCGKVRRPGVDVGGLLLSAVALALIVFSLIEGSRLGWWTPGDPLSALGLTWPSTAPVSPVPVAMIVGLALLAIFVRWESHRARLGRAAILDLTLFRVTTFSWGNVTALVVAAGEFALVFVLPLFLVNALGLSIMHAGWMLAAMALGALFAGSSARHLAARWTPARVVVIGLALELIGLILIALVIELALPVWTITIPLVVYGVGVGLASAQRPPTILRDVPAEESGAASATQSTARQIGSAVGTAIAGTSLAAGLHLLLPERLAALPDISAELADQLTSSVSSSAGGAIPVLRDQVAAGQGPLGTVGPAAVDTIAEVFGQATAVSVLVSAAFLVLGLLGALRV